MAEGGGKARGVLSVKHSRNPPRQCRESCCTATPRALMSHGSAVAHGTDGHRPGHPGGESCVINPQPRTGDEGGAVPCPATLQKEQQTETAEPAGEALSPPTARPSTARTTAKLSGCRGGSALLRKPCFSDSLSRGDLTNICLLTAAAPKLTWSLGHFNHRSETTAKGP